jgi:hypothetical protein
MIAAIAIYLGFWLLTVAIQVWVQWAVFGGLDREEVWIVIRIAAPAYFLMYALIFGLAFALTGA